MRLELLPAVVKKNRSLPTAVSCVGELGPVDESLGKSMRPSRGTARNGHLQFLPAVRAILDKRK